MYENSAYSALTTTRPYLQIIGAATGGQITGGWAAERLPDSGYGKCQHYVEHL